MIRRLRALERTLACIVGLFSSGTALAQEPWTLEPLDATGRVTFFVAEGAPDSGYIDGDRELAMWAVEAWQRAARGALRFEPGPEATALVRVYFVPASFGQYGEMRAIEVAGRRGAAVFVRPDTSALGAQIARLAAADPLLRDAIVYLTCLHELGHALGLAHTADFADLMYSFQFGGDIPAFFGRYRAELKTRADIARASGLSAGDLAQLHALYDARPASEAQ